MRWPAPRNPKPYSKLDEKSKQIGASGREARTERFLRQKEDGAVLAAMPAEASAIAIATGLTIDHVGAALSRLKARGQAEKRGRQWWPS
jgi:predicted Rossmann fold nucleotide-binding protein DprA/Smf involved in DNA uptake